MFDKDEGILIQRSDGGIGVTIPYAWIDQLVDYYNFSNAEVFNWEAFFPLEEKSYLSFAELECSIRHMLNTMGDWESWAGFGHHDSEQKICFSVSDRIEKAFRCGFLSLAMTAIKHGFPCDTVLGSIEDNQLYAYVVSMLKINKHRWIHKKFVAHVM